jgi:sodium/hydrogen antiporter
VVALGFLASLVFGFGLLAGRLEGTVVTAPMVFVTAGVVAGGTGILDFGAAAHATGGHSREAVFLVAEVALVLLLFSDAARIDPRALRGNAIPLRLLLIGLPLSIAVGTVLALELLSDLEFWECAIVAAVLAPTDAALGQAVVSSPMLPVRIRQGLNVESGLNDGGTVPFLTLFIALAALAVIAWFVADEAGGNGFIAAFVGGGAAGVVIGPELRGRVLEFAEEEGEFLNVAVFLLFGVFAWEALGDTTWQIVLYAVLSLTVVRMVPVAIAVIGLRLRASTIAFLGWFGPRGLASVILALVVVEEEPELTGLSQLFLTMTVAVLLSVFAHGITAAPLTRRYARVAGALGPGSSELEAVVELPTRRRSDPEPVGG